MSDIDEVFARFREANPVTDVSALDSTAPPWETVVAADGGSPVVQPARGVRTRRATWRWPVAAAAMAVIALIGSVWLFDRDDREAIETLSPTEVVRRDARDLAQRWLAAANGGDLQAMIDVSRPSSPADVRLFEWLIGLAEVGLTTEIDGCEVTAATESAALVDCQVRLDNPVAAQLGVDHLVAPFGYSEGEVSWQPYRGGDVGRVNAAFADYLAAYEPERYRATCHPSAYEPGSVVADNGLALTGECAELAGPLADEVVEWIRKGRPEPGDE